jgi:hypothetical protein
VQGSREAFKPINKCLREVGMSRPLLVAVEDDAERFPLLERELRNG